MATKMVIDLDKVRGGMAAVTDGALEARIAAARKNGDGRIVLRQGGVEVPFRFRGRMVTSIDVGAETGYSYHEGNERSVGAGPEVGRGSR